MDDKAPPTVGKGAIMMINYPKSFEGMNIEDITMKETISDFTCRQSATTRYWKAPLKFKKNGKVVDSLHISIIRIPYFKDKYGREIDGYSYACFDLYVREGIARMPRHKLPANDVQATSGNLVSTPEEWWQNVGSTNKTVSVLGRDVMFHPNNIRVLMDATERGIVVNGEFFFFVESSREQDMKILLEERAP
ncbi:hypothetical protein K4K48_006943 [Colletotrichum sp. SAR 10_66]|nr:hypothetical protein K4K48_006943 [Colletotrichum sp. SAR 10_66]